MKMEGGGNTPPDIRVPSVAVAKEDGRVSATPQHLLCFSASNVNERIRQRGRREGKHSREQSISDSKAGENESVCFSNTCRLEDFIRNENNISCISSSAKKQESRRKEVSSGDPLPAAAGSSISAVPGEEARATKSEGESAQRGRCEAATAAPGEGSQGAASTEQKGERTRGRSLTAGERSGHSCWQGKGYARSSSSMEVSSKANAKAGSPSAGAAKPQESRTLQRTTQQQQDDQTTHTPPAVGAPRDTAIPMPLQDISRCTTRGSRGGSDKRRSRSLPRTAAWLRDVAATSRMQVKQMKAKTHDSQQKQRPQGATKEEKRYREPPLWRQRREQAENDPTQQSLLLHMKEKGQQDGVADTDSMNTEPMHLDVLQQPTDGESVPSTDESSLLLQDDDACWQLQNFQEERAALQAASAAAAAANDITLVLPSPCSASSYLHRPAGSPANSGAPISSFSSSSSPSSLSHVAPCLNAAVLSPSALPSADGSDAREPRPSRPLSRLSPEVLAPLQTSTCKTTCTHWCSSHPAASVADTPPPDVGLQTAEVSAVPVHALPAPVADSAAVSAPSFDSSLPSSSSPRDKRATPSAPPPSTVAPSLQQRKNSCCCCSSPVSSPFLSSCTATPTWFPLSPSCAGAGPGESASVPASAAAIAPFPNSAPCPPVAATTASKATALSAAYATLASSAPSSPRRATQGGPVAPAASPPAASSAVSTSPRDVAASPNSSTPPPPSSTRLPPSSACPDSPTRRIAPPPEDVSSRRSSSCASPSSSEPPASLSSSLPSSTGGSAYPLFPPTSSLPALDRIRTLVRVRPLQQEEQSGSLLFQVSSDTRIRIQDLQHQQGVGNHEYVFDVDKVFGPTATQEEVWQHVAACVEKAVDGYNCTLFAHGQTGTGKTYTMLGSDVMEGCSSCDTSAAGATSPATAAAAVKNHGTNFSNDFKGLKPLQRLQRLRKKYQQLAKCIPELMKSASRGIIPRACELIFEQIKHTYGKDLKGVKVFASYIQIYNEKLIDLLAPPDAPASPPLSLVTDPQNPGSVVVKGLQLFEVRSSSELLQLLLEGTLNRVFRATGQNGMSSRSHAIFQVEIRRTIKHEQQHCVKTSRLILVDLAGNERCEGARAAEKAHMAEMGAINRSLSILTLCIQQLARGERVVSFRSSNLTRLLRESLGGRCWTIFICTVTPAALCMRETLATLRLAVRAKSVKVLAKLNEPAEAAAAEASGAAREGEEGATAWETSAAAGGGATKALQEEIIFLRRVLRPRSGRAKSAAPAVACKEGGKCGAIAATGGQSCKGSSTERRSSTNGECSGSSSRNRETMAEAAVEAAVDATAVAAEDLQWKDNSASMLLPNMEKRVQRQHVLACLRQLAAIHQKDPVFPWENLVSAARAAAAAGGNCCRSLPYSEAAPADATENLVAFPALFGSKYDHPAALSHRKNSFASTLAGHAAGGTEAVHECKDADRRCPHDNKPCQQHPCQQHPCQQHTRQQHPCQQHPCQQLEQQQRSDAPALQLLKKRVQRRMALTGAITFPVPKSSSEDENVAAAAAVGSTPPEAATEEVAAAAAAAQALEGHAGSSNRRWRAPDSLDERNHAECSSEDSEPNRGSRGSSSRDSRRNSYQPLPASNGPAVAAYRTSERCSAERRSSNDSSSGKRPTSNDSSAVSEAATSTCANAFSAERTSSRHSEDNGKDSASNFSAGIHNITAAGGGGASAASVALHASKDSTALGSPSSRSSVCFHRRMRPIRDSSKDCSSSSSGSPGRRHSSRKESKASHEGLSCRGPDGSRSSSGSSTKTINSRGIGSRSSSSSFSAVSSSKNAGNRRGRTKSRKNSGRLRSSSSCCSSRSSSELSWPWDFTATRGEQKMLWATGREEARQSSERQALQQQQQQQPGRQPQQQRKEIGEPDESLQQERHQREGPPSSSYHRYSGSSSTLESSKSRDSSSGSSRQSSRGPSAGSIRSIRNKVHLDFFRSCSNCSFDSGSSNDVGSRDTSEEQSSGSSNRNKKRSTSNGGNHSRGSRLAGRKPSSKNVPDRSSFLSTAESSLSYPDATENAGAGVCSSTCLSGNAGGDTPLQSMTTAAVAASKSSYVRDWSSSCEIFGRSQPLFYFQRQQQQQKFGPLQHQQYKQQQQQLREPQQQLQQPHQWRQPPQQHLFEQQKREYQAQQEEQGSREPSSALVSRRHAPQQQQGPQQKLLGRLQEQELRREQQLRLTRALGNLAKAHAAESPFDSAALRQRVRLRSPPAAAAGAAVALSLPKEMSLKDQEGAQSATLATSRCIPTTRSLPSLWEHEMQQQQRPSELRHQQHQQQLQQHRQQITEQQRLRQQLLQQKLLLQQRQELWQQHLRMQQLQHEQQLPQQTQRIRPLRILQKEARGATTPPGAPQQQQDPQQQSSSNKAAPLHYCAVASAEEDDDASRLFSTTARQGSAASKFRCASRGAAAAVKPANLQRDSPFCTPSAADRVAHTAQTAAEAVALYLSGRLTLPHHQQRPSQRQPVHALQQPELLLGVHRQQQQDSQKQQQSHCRRQSELLPFQQGECEKFWTQQRAFQRLLSLPQQQQQQQQGQERWARGVQQPTVWQQSTQPQCIRMMQQTQVYPPLHQQHAVRAQQQHQPQQATVQPCVSGAYGGYRYISQTQPQHEQQLLLRQRDMMQVQPNGQLLQHQSLPLLPPKKRDEKLLLQRCMSQQQSALEDEMMRRSGSDPRLCVKSRYSLDESPPPVSQRRHQPCRQRIILQEQPWLHEYNSMGSAAAAGDTLRIAPPASASPLGAAGVRGPAVGDVGAAASCRAGSAASAPVQYARLLRKPYDDGTQVVAAAAEDEVRPRQKVAAGDQAHECRWSVEARPVAAGLLSSRGGSADIVSTSEVAAAAADTAATHATALLARGAVPTPSQAALAPSREAEAFACTGNPETAESAVTSEIAVLATPSRDFSFSPLAARASSACSAARPNDVSEVNPSLGYAEPALSPSFSASSAFAPPMAAAAAAAVAEASGPGAAAGPFATVAGDRAALDTREMAAEKDLLLQEAASLTSSTTAPPDSPAGRVAGAAMLHRTEPTDYRERQVKPQQARPSPTAAASAAAGGTAAGPAGAAAIYPSFGGASAAYRQPATIASPQQQQREQRLGQRWLQGQQPLVRKFHPLRLIHTRQPQQLALQRGHEQEMQM